MGEKNRNITTLPGTIKVAKDDYVEFLKDSYLRQGFTEEKSRKMAGNDFYRISIKSAERRAKIRLKGK